MVSQYDISDQTLRWIFLIPSVLILAFLTIVPFIAGIYMSLHEWSLAGGGTEFIGLENYWNLLLEERFQNSIYATTIFTAVTISAELILGIGLAIYLRSLTQGWRNVCLTIFMIPMVVTPIATALSWRLMLNSNIGVINYLIELTGLQAPEWTSSPLLAMTTIVMVDIWQWTPLVIMIVYAGLLSISPKLYEAARMDSAPGWATFWHITLPQIQYMVAIAAVFRLMRSFRSFDIIWLVTQGGPGTATEILNVYLYRVAFVFLKGGKAAALGIILLIVTIGVCMSILRALGVQGNE